MNHIKQTNKRSGRHFPELLMLLLLGLLVFFVYSNTLNNPFVFDSHANISNNPHIRLSSLTLEGIKNACLKSPAAGRPVANISFVMNYYFHQYNVMGYHLFNIIIHILTCISIYFFSKTTLLLWKPIKAKNNGAGHERQPTDTNRKLTLSSSVIVFCATVIWAVNPVHIQSVTYIVQRMNSMAAMFYILSLLLYSKGRILQIKRANNLPSRLSGLVASNSMGSALLFAGSVIAGILAFGAKEIAATLPFFVFLYEWYFFQDLSYSWLKRYALRIAGMVIVFAIFVLMILITDGLQKMLNLYSFQDFTLTQRMLTEFRVVVYYLSLFAFPHPSRLNIDYDYPLSFSLVDPSTTIISICAICGLIVLAVLAAKKERILSFGILWFLGNLIIESSVIPLAIIYEHRTYLPSIFLSLVAVVYAYRYVRPVWLIICVMCIVVVCCSWTYKRNGVWSSEFTLWRDCIKKSPQKSRPHTNYGKVLFEHNMVNKAIEHYMEALRIDPKNAKANYNLGNALFAQGKFDDSIKCFSEAIKIQPDNGVAHNNLGAALLAKGNVVDAVKHIRKAIGANPYDANAHNNLGKALSALSGSHNRQDAIRHYNEALRLDNGSWRLHNNLGAVLLDEGRTAEAIKHFQRALRLKPDYTSAQKNLQKAMESR